MKLNNIIFNHKQIFILFAILILFLTIVSGFKTAKSAKLAKVESEAFASASTSASAESTSTTYTYSSMEKKKHKNRKIKKVHQNNGPTGNTAFIKNDTLVNSGFLRLNQSFVKQDLNTFKSISRKWDWKLLDKQLDDIYHDMNFRTEVENTPRALQAFMSIFVNSFQNCDKNGNNVLEYEEFVPCLNNDTALSTILVPTTQYVSYINYTFTNTTGFYKFLFDILDTHKTNYTNFHGYMTLRLLAFSWKKCSVNGPYIEESNFECALDIASGTRNFHGSTVRRIFSLALELVNPSMRNMDFITYILFSSSVRLFGKINGKENSDITIREFNVALDNNILPMRYNQDIINQMFHLIAEQDKPNQGIDVLSFVFYDYFLRIFDQPTSASKKKSWYLTGDEFRATLSHYLFPNKTYEEITKVNQNGLTPNSYNMYSYLNISNFYNEGDHLLRSFLETDEKIMYINRNRFNGASASIVPSGYRFLAKKDNILNYIDTKNHNLTFSLINTSALFFEILDHDNDRYLDFYEFGTFIQVSYLFTKFDPYYKGRLLAGDLYEKFTQYSDLPVLNYLVRERAKRFNLIPQDIYLDLSTTLLVMRIDDIISTFVRRSDKTTLYEVEIKNILSFTNMRFIPDNTLNKCLRGTDQNNVPLYDWECSFIESLILNLKYYEYSYAYLTTHNLNLTLSNTVFVNPDKILG